MDEFEAIGVIPDECLGETLADYQKAAKAAVAKAIEEEGVKKSFSPLGALYFHVERAFCGAVAIAIQSRHFIGPLAESEPIVNPLAETFIETEWERFIFLYMQLEEDWEHICQVYTPNSDMLKNWPRNPGVTFGGESSWSYLVLAVDFSGKILSLIQSAQSASGLDSDEYHAIKTFADSNPRMAKWQTIAMRGLKNKLPPVDKWDSHTICEQGKSLLWKLNDEYRQAMQGEKKARAENDEDWLTVSKAAKISGINLGVISRAASKGYIITNGKRGRERRLDHASFNQYILDKSNSDKGETTEQVISKMKAQGLD